MLTTQSGETVEANLVFKYASLLSEFRSRFDPDTPAMLDDFVTDLEFALWRVGDDGKVPEDGAEAMVGYAITGELDFR